MEGAEERLTPNALAELCVEQIAKLSAEKKAAKSDRVRKALALRMKSCRTLLRFAKTRAGYSPALSSRRKAVDDTSPAPGSFDSGTRA